MGKVVQLRTREDRMRAADTERHADLPVRDAANAAAADFARRHGPGSIGFHIAVTDRWCIPGRRTAHRIVADVIAGEFLNVMTACGHVRGLSALRMRHAHPSLTKCRSCW